MIVVGTQQLGGTGATLDGRVGWDGRLGVCDVCGVVVVAGDAAGGVRVGVVSPAVGRVLSRGPPDIICSKRTLNIFLFKIITSSSSLKGIAVWVGHEQR